MVGGPVGDLGVVLDAVSHEAFAFAFARSIVGANTVKARMQDWMGDWMGMMELFEPWPPLVNDLRGTQGQTDPSSPAVKACLWCELVVVVPDVGARRRRPGRCLGRSAPGSLALSSSSLSSFQGGLGRGGPGSSALSSLSLSSFQGGLGGGSSLGGGGVLVVLVVVTGKRPRESGSFGASRGGLESSGGVQGVVAGSFGAITGLECRTGWAIG